MLTSDVPSNTADAIPRTSIQHAWAVRGRQTEASEEVNATEVGGSGKQEVTTSATFGSVRSVTAV